MWFVFFHLILTSVQAAPQVLSIDLEIEQAGKAHAKKDLGVEPSSDWRSLQNDSNLILLSRTPVSREGIAQSLELLILDSQQPGKIIAQPTIQLRDSEQTRARFKLDSGDWVSVKIKKN